MHRSRRVLVAVLLLAGLSVAAAGCQSDDGRRITIYSGRTEELVAPVLERFAADTGISVDVRYGESADLALLIGEEGDQSPADVFISQSPGAMGFIDGAGLLQPLPERILDRVDARFRASDGDWVGISGRVRVVVYNAETVAAAELPDSVFDLTAPRYRGRVGIAPTNASFTDFVTAMREVEGDVRTRRWLEAMNANGVETYANNIAIVDAVNRGEIDFGLVNHYYNEQAKAEDPDLATANHVLADGDIGSLVLVTGAGVLRGAGDEAGARELIEYLLRRESQEYFAQETFEYPLAAGVAPTVEDLPSLDEIQGPAVELSSLGDELAATRRMIEAAGLEG